MKKEITKRNRSETKGPSTGAAQGEPPFEAGRHGWVNLLVGECARDVNSGL